MQTIRQPRASIACSRNRDPEYLALAATVEGLAAVAVFDALLCAAKDQGNGGVFRAADSVVAMLCGVPESIFIQTKIKLVGLNWLTASDPGVLIIRSFAKWNPPDARGGARPGAGRPRCDTGKSNRNQNEIKTKSKRNQNVLAPSPFPSPVTTTTLSDSVESDGEGEGEVEDQPDSKPREARYSERFLAFWGFFPRKIGKGKAWAAFRRLNASDQQAAVEQAEAYAQAFALAPEARRQFFKHPTTWLNARSWEDSHAEWSLIIEGK